MDIDWKNNSVREDFEERLENSKAIRSELSFSQKVLRLIGIFGLQILCIIALYGSCGYIMITNANEEKKLQEEKMKIVWMTENNISTTDPTLSPKFEYFDFENYFFINVFPFMIVTLETSAMLSAILFHFTGYKKWSLLFIIIASCCLPVDVMIFYKEPVGPFGTLVVMVFAFVPFMTIVADAIFPEEAVLVKLKGNLTFFRFRPQRAFIFQNTLKKLSRYIENLLWKSFCINYFCSIDNKTAKLKKNGWTKHLSLTYNLRYNFVLRVTTIGYKFFATLSLSIYLLKVKI